MKKLLTCFLITQLPIAILGYCTLQSNEFFCNDTDYKNFLENFYDHSCRKFNISSTFSIKIEGSTFNQIDYFPNLFLTTQTFSTTHLTIRNSSVEIISDNALEEIVGLKYLDLTWNKIRNMFFVQYLPYFIEELYLSHNKISYIDNVFTRLRSMVYLDLSYNPITIIDFQNIFWIQRLNFSFSKIETLIPSRDSLRVTELDLSYNNIETFNEEELKNSFCFLDLSHNNLKKVVLDQGEKKFLGLSGNSMRKMLIEKPVKADYVDLSSTNTSLNFGNIKIIPKLKLILRNNKIGLLNRTTLNIFNDSRKFWPYRPKIDLSNSSIIDISPNYFGKLETVLLNLSNNNIHLLRNKVFLNSAIEVLDLSNSNIERIQSYAFKSLTSQLILLTGNKLEVISDIFNEVEVINLDLSFNRFKTITNHSFVNCRGLFFLNLGHCLIEKIEPGSFFGLEKLQKLVLSYNKLLILETSSFNNLPVRELVLDGNKIYTIRNRAFNSLHTLKKLDLSKVGLRNLEPFAFNNLSKVEEIDLTDNNITMIPHYLFMSMDNLRTVFLHGNNITTLNPFPNRLKLHTLTFSFRGMFKSSRILNLNIQHLHIVHSKIDILKNNSFAGLYNLRKLYFNNSYVYIETGALNHLFNLKFLDSRSLYKNMKVIKRYSFKDLKSLEFLDLSNLSLQHVESRAFIGMISLINLLLNDNNLVELKNNTFDGLSSLKVLNLSNCNIEKCEEESLHGFDSLEILHLAHNNLLSIESEFLFGSLRSLLELHLEHNNISMLHIKSFLGLHNLQSLHLQHNSLEEFPIGVFQYLTKLKVLDLSNNLIKLLKTGALSNLQSLEVLNLSDNLLVNLEYVDIFFSLKQLQIVQFDGNYLKLFDFKRFLINLRKISYVGISNNKWKCDTLSYIIESFNNRSIDYRPKKLVFDEDNIDGIGCVDMCKFVYCSHENVEQILHHNY